MAQLKTPKAQEFDTLVIGAGLSGLIVANALEATGRNVALVEAADHIGGASRMGATRAGPIDHGLKLIPESAAAHEALDWLETVIGEKIERSIIEAAPVNYDDGKFKPYVGFGDTSVTTASEIEAQALNSRLRVSSTPKDWVQKLNDLYTGTLLTQSQVTKMAIEDGFIIESIINGAKRICAREVIFTGAPNTLIPILPEGALAPRIRQKLLRGDFWTSVNLDLVHPHPITDSKSVHVLKGANEEPTVGLFHEPIATEDGRTLQVSQWFTLIPRDQIDEEELVAGALKQIKRQLKRAYESALEGLVQERILVSPASHGSLLGGFDVPGRLPKIENLWLTSSFFSDQRNTLGTLIQAQKVIQEIGDHFSDTDLHKDSEIPRTAEV